MEGNYYVLYGEYLPKIKMADVLVLSPRVFFLLLNVIDKRMVVRHYRMDLISFVLNK